MDSLTNYAHGLLVLNIKEAGIEAEVIRLVEARNMRGFSCWMSNFRTFIAPPARGSDESPSGIPKTR